jgi:hypothetical protein
LSTKLRSMFTWVRAGYRSHIPTFFGAVGLRSSHRRYRQSNIANGFSDRTYPLESRCCADSQGRSGNRVETCDAGSRGSASLLVHRLLNPLGFVVFKMGRLQGGRKEHIWIDT